MYMCLYIFIVFNLYSFICFEKYRKVSFTSIFYLLRLLFLRQTIILFYLQGFLLRSNFPFYLQCFPLLVISLSPSLLSTMFHLQLWPISLSFISFAFQPQPPGNLTILGAPESRKWETTAPTPSVPFSTANIIAGLIARQEHLQII